MGQATVDLPDPSEVPHAPGLTTTVTSADDLLSQLAGDEIDRLLAEAEVEKAPAPGASNGAAANGAAPVDEAPEPSPTDAQLDDLMTQLRAEAGDAAVSDVGEPAAAGGSLPTERASAPPAAAGSTSVSTAPATPTDADLDDLMAQLEAGNETAPSAPPAPHPVATSAAEAPVETSQPAPESTIPDPSAAAKELDDALAKASTDSLPQIQSAIAAATEVETSTEEKNALNEAVDQMDTEADESPAVESEPDVPLVLKPLVWFNAPLDLLPEAVRDAIGKVAILTLANAIAVLVYVLLFRKHH